MNAMFNERDSSIQEDTIEKTQSRNTIDEVGSLRENGRRFGTVKIDNEIRLEIWEFNNFFAPKKSVFGLSFVLCCLLKVIIIFFTFIITVRVSGEIMNPETINFIKKLSGIFSCIDLMIDRELKFFSIGVNCLRFTRLSFFIAVHLYSLDVI